MLKVLSICGKGMLLIGVDKLLFSSPFVVHWGEDTALYIDEKGQESKGKIPRHGLVRKKEFELVEQTENSVTFAIEDDENSYQNYPYHFRLEITYILTGKTVRTQYKIF